MFGRDSQPSIVYSYGARQPVEGIERVRDQIWRAHRYRNALVEIELNRRERLRIKRTEMFPELASLENQLSALLTELADTRKAIKRENQSERKRTKSPEQENRSSRAREISASLRTLRLSLKQEKARIFETPEWESAASEIDGWADSEIKRLRRESGLYWGTYLTVEQSLGHSRSGIPPRFKRWDGHGKIAVQVQGGMPTRELFEGTSSLVQANPVPEDAWKPSNRKFRKTVVRFRIGSDGPKGDIPIWCVIPIVLHRSLPPDAQIKWAYLVRHRIATHDTWSVQFVLSRERGWAKPDVAETGKVGIDIGWRVLDEGLRVAYWVGSDGQEGQLVLPISWIEQRKKTHDLRSIQDKMFEEARSYLVGWLGHREDLPGWFDEARKTLSTWKSHGRLSGLVVKWRRERFDGDQVAFETLEKWRKQAKHLYEWERNLEDQLLSWRLDLYRNFAAMIRRRYRTVAVEEFDLRVFQRIPEPEDELDIEAARKNRTNACCSSLRLCLSGAADYVKVPAKDTTRRCNACGSMEEFDRADLFHTCGACGVRYDQDRNAALNLLDLASAPVPLPV